MRKPRTLFHEPVALPLADAAGSLGISLATLKRLIADRQVRTVRLGRRRRVVPCSELQRLVTSATRQE